MVVAQTGHMAKGLVGRCLCVWGRTVGFRALQNLSTGSIASVCTAVRAQVGILGHRQKRVDPIQQRTRTYCGDHARR